MVYVKRNFAYNKRLTHEDFNYIDAQLIEQQARSNELRDTGVQGVEDSIPVKIQTANLVSSSGHVQIKYGNLPMKSVYLPTMDTYLPPTAISSPQAINAWRGVKQKLEFSVTPANSSLTPRFIPADKSMLRIDKDGIMTPLKIGRTSVTVRCGTISKTIPVLISAFIRPIKLYPGISFGMQWNTANQYMYWDTVDDWNDNRFLEIALVGSRNSFFAFPIHGGDSYEFQLPPHCTATFHIDNTGLDMENGSIERYYKIWYYHVVKARTTAIPENWYQKNKSNLVTDPPEPGKIALVQSPTSQAYFIVNSDIANSSFAPTQSGVILLEEADRLRDLVIHNTSDATWYPCLALTVQYSPVTHDQWIQAMQRFSCTIVPD